MQEILHLKKRVVLIVPYFGKLPSYFDAFIKSVNNKNFDVLFFSDAAKPQNLPLNFKWYISTFEAIKQLIKAKLERDIVLNKPYKLCDYRPAFGLIFEDYIKIYTFWGSIDLDTCMGNFDAFINDSVLDSLDIFSGIKEYISGSFFLIRNNRYCNTLFKKSKSLNIIFQTEEYLGFDECGGRFFNQLKAGKTFEELRPPVESFTEILLKEPPAQTRILFKNVIAEPKRKITKVDANAITLNNNEYLLVHHIYYKTWYSFYTNKKVRLPFYINRLGFFQYKPSWLNVFFSKNLWLAVFKKLEINLLKIRSIFWAQ